MTLSTPARSDGASAENPPAAPAPGAAAAPTGDSLHRRFRTSLQDGRVHPLYVALRHHRAGAVALPATSG